MDGNGFTEYRRLIVSELHRLSTEISALEAKLAQAEQRLGEKLVTTNLDVRELKTRVHFNAGIIAAITGAAVAIVVRLIAG